MSSITNKSVVFLDDLKENNNRPWFQDNKERYEAMQAEMISFADEVLIHLAKQDEIETLSGKKSLYRIYRDIRFSKNKTPYKINRSGIFKRKGAERRGSYYFSISPNETFIGGGFFGPEKDDLKLIRQQIELDAEPLVKVLKNKKIKQFYGKLEGSQLKTVPRGFSIDNPNIELLRHKSFIFRHSFTKEEVLKAGFAKKVAEGFLILQPFLDVMTDYLTTNLNGESTL